MKKITAFVVTFLCFCAGLLAQTPTKTVKGRVTDDSTGTGLPDATVSVSNPKQTVKTDAAGSFSIKLPEDGKKHTITVSYSGYTSISLSVKADETPSFSLKRDVKEIEDVVVIGYTPVKRRDLLSPVATVGAKQLKDVPINSTAEALAGRLAGVQVTSAEGSPDAEIKIRVRGGGSITQDNSPLYIIDGIQVESGLTGIAIQDIETVDVLKDAAATAIYGARGANGVIIITTKSGKAGSKINVNYNAFVGVKKVAKKLDVLSPYDYVVLQYERAQLGSQTDRDNFSKKYGTTWDTLSAYKNIDQVDWQEQVLGRNAVTTTHNLSLNGGSKKLTYNAGYTFNKEQGIVFTSDYRRHLGNLKLEYKPIKDLKIGFSGRIADQVVDGVSTSSEGSASFNRLRQLIKYKPFLGANESIDQIDPDLFDETNGNGLALINPIVLMRAETKKKKQLTSNAGFSVDYKLFKNVRFKSTVGIDITKVKQWYYQDSVTSDSRINGGAKPIMQTDTSTKRVLNNSNVITWNVNNYKKYHSWTLLAGHEIYNIDYKQQSHRRRDIALFTGPDKALSENSGTEDIARGYPLPTEYHSKLVSFFGKLNYSFKDKYLLSYSVRTDGSSKFAPENRWGVFQSGSIAWRISKEKFLKNVKWLSELKVRGGYGEAGNNRIDDYLYITILRASNPYGLNDNISTGFYPQNLVNYNLKWETNVNTNVGLDASFLKNRIDFSIDFYKNSAEDLLISAPVSPVLGYSTQLQNVGATTNKGIELQINATPIRNKNFTWSINFNNAWNKNLVKRLAKGVDTLRGYSGWSATGLEDFVVTVGQPVGAMYGFVTDGFYTADDFNPGSTPGTYVLKPGVVSNNLYSSTVGPGTLKLKDLNGDGVVTSADRKIIGNANPKFTGGLNQQFTYKNFDLSVFVNWSVGGDVMNANKIEFSNTYTPYANGLELLNNRWRSIDANGNLVTDLNQLKEMNKNTTMWKPLPQGAGNNAFLLHSWAIEDGSFLRINNISLGYNLPEKMLKSLHIKRLRVYATVNNVAVITGYSGYDPEVNTRRTSGLTPNVDYSAYPRSRSFIFGFNTSF